MLEINIPEIENSIQQKINNFNAFYEKCVIWDESNATEVLNKIPFNINKLHKMYIGLSSILFTLKTEQGKLYQEKYIFYKTDFDIVLKDSEIKQFVLSDVEYNKVMSIIHKIETLLDSIEKAIKNIDSMRWDIKNYLEWKKFQSGNI